jgi:hypothetical protein
VARHDPRCSQCKRRRPDTVIATQRLGGGSCKRPARWYTTTICVECAREVLAAARRSVERGAAREPEKVDMLLVSDVRRSLAAHDAATVAG